MIDSGTESRRISIRLKFYFAALTCLGGLVLSAGTESSSVPVIAVFFAVFGFVFVDWLELFALPPIAAYAAMGVAALFCVSDFIDMDAPGNHQMAAVAQLLVFVQAILMLQRKTRRIFEQLGVFCLLELIVAAVFNNAISYGLLLIPIAVIGAWALTLLSALSATEGLAETEEWDVHEEISVRKSPGRQEVITVSSPESWASLSRFALRLPQIALLTFAPAVILVGSIFFYALPRTTDAARVQNRANAIVGFSDELRLEQIGQMMQSTQAALRIYLTDHATGNPYPLVGGVYLRGKVLERYRARISGDRNTAIWNSAPTGTVSEAQQLPTEYVPPQRTDQSFYDKVDVNVVCESTRSGALFAIAPYHRNRTNPDVVHFAELWTLARNQENDWVYPRIEYRFGTHAFRSGIQSELTTYRGKGDPVSGGLGFGQLGSRLRSLQEIADQRRQEAYEEELLEFDIDAMPTAAELGSSLVLNSAGERRTDYEIAKAMERHFVQPLNYEYTLKLDAESLPGMDPIEQFLRVDKRGHCQYFASALAMMLRSQGIPARLVAGYHTDEYNEFGEHYVARQLHAHAWVEALIPREQFVVNQRVYGQAPSDLYWLRLDPTPAAGRLRESGGGVSQVLDMAQTMWDDYVVDMDAERQENILIGGGSNPMNRSYKQFVDRLSVAIGRIRAGELGGGSLAWRNVFSWQAAVMAGLLTLVVMVLLRFRPPAWIRRRLSQKAAQAIAVPSVPFYLEVLRQLERLGLVRSASQTPEELKQVAMERYCDPALHPLKESLQFLTSTFYQHRFGRSVDLEKPLSIEHAHRLGADPRQVQVDQALAELTQSVDSVLIQQSNREHAT